MTYIIKKTNGNTLTTIADGVADSATSSITLFGKNYAGYGPLMDENLVKILENFSYPTAPNAPMEGQLWWDSLNNTLKVRRPSGWKNLAPTPSTTAPFTDTAGDLWYDTINGQLHVSNGGNWTIVGPAFTTGQGVSGMVPVTLPESLTSNTHTAVLLQVGGITQAVLSGDAPYNTNVIPGLTTIRRGLNMVTGAQVHGDSNNALNLGGVLAANYLRSDINSTTNGTLRINNNGGLIVGATPTLMLNVVGTTGNIINPEDAGDIAAYVSVGGILTRALLVSGVDASIIVAADPVDPLGISTKQYVDTSVATATAPLLAADGSKAVSGNLLPATSGTVSLGSSALPYGVVHSTAFIGSTITANTGTFTSITVTNTNPTTPGSLASKAYVDNSSVIAVATAAANTTAAIAVVDGGAPATLGTLNKLATALGDDPAFSVTVSNAIALKANIASPSLLGVPIAPTAPVGTVTNQLATTAFVKNALANATLTGSTSADILIANLGLEINGGNVTTITNGTINIGSATNKFDIVYANKFVGVATTALYADLAENYTADQQYGPGTVLEFGGTEEVTKTESLSTRRVAGVVSTAPAYLMNSGCTGKYVVAIALQGRCPVRVFGPVMKGDCLVSGPDGRAVVNNTPQSGCLLGKALENFEGIHGTIEISVSRS